MAFLMYLVSVHEPKNETLKHIIIGLVIWPQIFDVARKYLTMSVLVVIIRHHRKVWGISVATQWKSISHKGINDLRHGLTVSLCQPKHQKAWNIYCVFKEL